MEISKKDFESYEEVRRGGRVNMFNVQVVSMMSGLDKPTIFAIMKQYGELAKQYPDVIEDD